MGLFNYKHPSLKEYYEGPDGIQQSGDELYGDYQFTSLADVISGFIIAYVGEDKIISRVKRPDVIWHAKRALQELSFDTFRSCKTQEIEVCPTLTMPLPHDYVNYVKLTWVDSSGIEHIIYPARNTSNPLAIAQEDNCDYKFAETSSCFDVQAWVYPGEGPPPPTSTMFNILYLTSDPCALGITVGMVVTGVGISGTAIVIAVDCTLNTVTLDENVIYAKQPAITWTFCSSADAGLLYQYETTINLTDITYVVGHNFINDNVAIAAGTATEVTVGMRVISHDFPSGTYVTEIQNTNVIIVSSNATGSSNATSVDTIYFITPNILSDTWNNYKGATPSENQDDYEDDTWWPYMGQRHGLDPQYSQVNGSFFIDCVAGKIHFSSNLGGKTIILEYLSDSLGTDEEMKVPKLAEEAVYKWIAYGVLSTRSNIPEYIVMRLKKEKFAETRKAKIRLSNIKIEEIAQIMRGKSKWIKH